MIVDRVCYLCILVVWVGHCNIAFVQQSSNLTRNFQASTFHILPMFFVKFSETNKNALSLSVNARQNNSVSITRAFAQMRYR